MGNNILEDNFELNHSSNMNLLDTLCIDLIQLHLSNNLLGITMAKKYLKDNIVSYMYYKPNSIRYHRQYVLLCLQAWLVKLNQLLDTRNQVGKAYSNLDLSHALD
jgi:hypothetical protein